jgi:hypothetical protein
MSLHQRRLAAEAPRRRRTAAVAAAGPEGHQRWLHGTGSWELCCVRDQHAAHRSAAGRTARAACASASWVPGGCAALRSHLVCLQRRAPLTATHLERVSYAGGGCSPAFKVSTTRRMSEMTSNHRRDNMTRDHAPTAAAQPTRRRSTDAGLALASGVHFA